MSISGIIIVNKQQGISSHTEMRRVQRLFNASKAGHAGTLDPLATGMLPIYFGEATKFIQYALDSDKTYVATGVFGTKTNTSDNTGSIIWEHPNPIKPSFAELSGAVSGFIGEISQVPSMYSALKYNGRPLYDYARKGQTIARPARIVHIIAFEILSYEWPYFTVRVTCSKGTYIRNLLEDLGDSLGIGAHLTALHRESVQGFHQANMHTHANLLELSERDLNKQLYAIDHGLSHLDILYMPMTEIVALQQGKVVVCEDAKPGKIFRLYNNEQQKFYGLVKTGFELISNTLEVRAQRMLSPKQDIT